MCNLPYTPDGVSKFPARVRKDRTKQGHPRDADRMIQVLLLLLAATTE